MPGGTRGNGCKHANIVVQQNPDNGREEILKCANPDCTFQRTRVSSAASMQEAADRRFGEMQVQFENEREGNRQREHEKDQAIAALRSDVAALNERLVKLEERQDAVE